jgi:benzoyl-CoA reductase/2-hydroxyglutaryl-CoA dehydratase subunit BcrC/BadD/HgdB
VARDDLVFAREIAGHGADIVADETRLLGGFLDVEVPAAAETLEEVARAYFRQPDIGVRPNDAYFTALKKKVESTGVDGVLFRCLKFCDVHFGEQRRIREALAPLPVLLLDDEYDAAARPRRETRVGAFMEMLRCRKA